MTDTGFTFHRNGDISLDWRGDRFWIRLPSIGESRRIEEQGVQISDEIMATIPTEKLREAVGRIVEARDSGDEALLAELNAEFGEELVDAAKRLAVVGQEKSIEWLQQVIGVVGSDNWPADPDDWPAPCRNSALVKQIKDHWANVPLASGAPAQNGAPAPTTQMV